MTDIEIDKALDALENSRSLEPVDLDWVKGKRKAVIATLRAALAESEQAPYMYPLQSDRMQIDPVTGNVSIGKPLAEPKTQHDVSGFGKD